MLRPTWSALGLSSAMLAGALSLAVPAGAASVVINEIYYHPAYPNGSRHEFVELHNASNEAVDLSGWRFKEGIEFAFPDGASLDSGGYVVVAGDRAALLADFPGLDAGSVHGDFGGSLDNDGDELVLVDTADALIDSVRYDNREPWPEAPDLSETSLQRLCPSGFSQSAVNWTGNSGDPISPLAANVRTVCPPPVSTSPDVIISEIHYHPFDDAFEEEEFVEIHNPSGVPVSLAGWSLDLDDELFVFPAGLSLDPGAYLAVCRDQDFIRAIFGIENTVGNFGERLSNSDARLVLRDALGVTIDVAVYRDSGQYPFTPDGLGPSLERQVLRGPGDDPANWIASGLTAAEGEFIFLTGEAEATSSGRTLLAAIDGAGEYIVDDIKLEAVADGTVIFETDFEDPGADASWLFRGQSESSTFEDGIGVGGGRALRLVSSGRCRFDDCSSVEGGKQTLSGIQSGARYRLSASVRQIAGSPNLVLRVFSGPAADHRAALVTPGAPNTRSRGEPLPLLVHRGRFPEQPRSEQPIWLSVHVRTGFGGSTFDRDIESVAVTYFWEDVTESLPMFDDGMHADGLAGDGTYGVELPGFPHGSEVHYRFSATMSDGDRGFSPHAQSDEPGGNEVWGFYVNDLQPDTPIPTYTLLLPGLDPSDPEEINEFFGRFGCTFFREASFVSKGDVYPFMDVRFRGNTACFVKKRNLKLRFNQGRRFRGLNKMNLQSIWTDKGMIREDIAWDFVREIGMPYCETEYTRVHINGQYHGLFLYLEHPDKNFLRRNDLDTEGELFKAIQLEQFEPGVAPVRDYEPEAETYADLWEQEAREDGDFTEIDSFIEALHDDGRDGRPSRAFMEANVLPEMIIGFQVTQIVLNNIDSSTKNHFLYWDSELERWGFISWDLDLVFGKYFVALLENVPVGTLNDCMRSPTTVVNRTMDDFIHDLNPWAMTRVQGNILTNYLQDYFLRASVDHYQRAYLIRLWDIMREKYRNEVYDPRFDALADLLQDEQAEDLDRWGRYFPTAGCRDGRVNSTDMRVQIEVMKDQLRLHREFVMEYIDLYEGRSITDHDRMKITEILWDADGPAREEEAEFIELMNTSDREIDISGWKLTDSIEFTFPTGSTIARDETIVVTRSRAAFEKRYPHLAGSARVFGDWDGRLSNDGERIRLIDAGPGYPATIDAVEYDDEFPWPRPPEGHSLQLAQVSPDQDNDRPEYWKISTTPGGTPGETGLRFVRGDANTDDVVNLSDAIFTLSFLFQGGDAPLCEDAADANDDGAVNLSDPVFVLDFLFRGGATPPAPHPERGDDTTKDGLGCG